MDTRQAAEATLTAWGTARALGGPSSATSTPRHWPASVPGPRSGLALTLAPIPTLASVSGFLLVPAPGGTGAGTSRWELSLSLPLK